MLLGNNCDMLDNRAITTEQGQQFAREHSMQFLEISSKENINIDKAFKGHDK